MSDSVIVCEDVHTDRVSFSLGIVTMVCVGLSIMGLLVRVLLQPLIEGFASRPGRIQFHLTIAFLVAFVFLIVGPLVHGFPSFCVASAVVLCYGFLAAFTWMNIIAVDTWLAFRPTGAFVQQGQRMKSLWKLMLVGWGVPGILVSIIAGLNYSNIKNTYKPNFGGTRCWFTQRIALMTYFGLPIALSIVTNSVFYVYTAINLRNAFKDANCRAKKQREHHFIVYVRLFVLMGFTWIFGFLSAFIDRVAIDFIFVILTSLQGVFLFISFVCNKRVLKDLKKKFIKGNDLDSERKVNDQPAKNDTQAKKSENISNSKEEIKLEERGNESKGAKTGWLKL